MSRMVFALPFVMLALSAGAALFIGVLLLVTGRGRGGAIGRAEALVLGRRIWRSQAS